MMPILACLTSFLLACACCYGADILVHESATAQAPQFHIPQLLARQQPKPAALLLAHPRRQLGR